MLAVISSLTRPVSQRQSTLFLLHCDCPSSVTDSRSLSVRSHRLVLSSVSDYFAAMFTSDVREAKQDEVKMEGVDSDALWVLVQYAYTGTQTNTHTHTH